MLENNTLATEHVKNYMTAGNSVITIRSTVTGARYTYRIRSTKEYRDKPNRLLFVSVLTGSDNENSYTYIGAICQGGHFRLTEKSQMPMEATPVTAFHWFMKHVWTNTLPATCEVFHSGRCGRCGKRLTVPESIITGLGPHCATLSNYAT